MHEDFSPTVVLLHGIGMGRRMWADQIRTLSQEGFQVLAPDLPGFASRADEGPFTLFGAVEDVVRLLAGANVRSAHLCGLSLGAVVALSLALYRPDKVDSLVLSAVQYHPPKDLMDSQMEKIMQTSENDLCESLAEQVREADPRFLDEALEDARLTTKQGIVAALDSLSGMDLTERLPEVNVPSLVMCGAEDEPNLTASRELTDLLPEARLKEIKAAGHLWNLEYPQLFTNELTDFVGSVEVTRK